MAKRAKLPVVRQDWLSIHTFGQRAKERELRDVVEVTIIPVKGEKEIKLEAYVVPEISKIPNAHVEIARDNYPHLKGLWFSDVNTRQEELEIDVLVGADYLWDFQSNRAIRGKCNEPVAVETELGWVLSGPLQVLTGEKQQSQVETVQVNLIGSTRDTQVTLDQEVSKLWDLEGLGIRDSQDEVYENISFNGVRYSVKLP